MRLVWNKSIKQVAEKITKNKRVGLFLANTCEREMNPYVPMKSGALKDSAKVEPFKVKYERGYARHQWNGISRKSGRALNYTKLYHPKATKKWDEVCQRERGQKIAKEVSDYVKQI